MSDEKDRKIVFPSGGIFGDLVLRMRLILRLMADPRISPLVKLLPIGTVFYFLFPDLAPGPIDDVAVIWLGSYLFVELCPPHVVQEHMEALQQVIPGEWGDAPVDRPKVVGESPVPQAPQVKSDVIDAEFIDPED